MCLSEPLLLSSSVIVHSISDFASPHVLRHARHVISVHEANTGIFRRSPRITWPPSAPLSSGESAKGVRVRRVRDARRGGEGAERPILLTCAPGEH